MSSTNLAIALDRIVELERVLAAIQRDANLVLEQRREAEARLAQEQAHAKTTIEAVVQHRNELAVKLNEISARHDSQASAMLADLRNVIGCNKTWPGCLDAVRALKGLTEQREHDRFAGRIKQAQYDIEVVRGIAIKISAMLLETHRMLGGES